MSATGNLTTPRSCPGHRFPTDLHIRKMKPGTAIQCVWCGIKAGVKQDPRLEFGATFMPRWHVPRIDPRMA